MKPTSIIFIILAAVLIVAGVVICLVGNSMTSADNPLLCDSIEAGDEKVEHSLSEFELTNIDINIKDVNVEIIGKSEKNSIEFININKVTYDFVINKHKLTLSTVNPFNVSSMVKFRENEGGFAGLRHYLYLNRYNDKVSQIRIYVTADTVLENIKINTENGNITIKNMMGAPKYDITSETGSVTVENSLTTDVINVKVKSGDFNYTNSGASHLDFKVEKGNANFQISKQYNFFCKCNVAGSVIVDTENVGDSYEGVYPKLEPAEGAEIDLPDTVKGELVSGDLFIKYAEAEEPVETPEAAEPIETVE